MTAAQTVDGVLVQWGERLFYPSNRIVKTPPTPRLDTLTRRKAVVIRGRIVATVVRRAPQVVDMRARTYEEEPPSRWRSWRSGCSTCEPSAWPRMIAMAERVDGTLVDLAGQLPARFPARTWKSVATGMKRHAAQFLRAVENPRGYPRGREAKA